MGQYLLIVWKQKYRRGSRPEFKCESDDINRLRDTVLPACKIKYPQHWVGIYDQYNKGYSIIEVPPDGHNSRLLFEQEQAAKGMTSLYGKRDLPVNVYRRGKGKGKKHNKHNKRVKNDQNVSYSDMKQQAGFKDKS